MCKVRVNDLKKKIQEGEHRRNRSKDPEDYNVEYVIEEDDTHVKNNPKRSYGLSGKYHGF